MRESLLVYDTLFTEISQLVDGLRNMRAFYLAYPIWNAVRTELSWMHYRKPVTVHAGRDFIPLHSLLEDDPTPTLPLPGEGARESCVLVPPPGKGEVRWGSILRSRIWAMIETSKSAYGQALGMKA